MSERRPDERGFTRLPMLAESKVALETCTYCPKLCRTVCPVSNAEPREALTPWGKMSSAYHLAPCPVLRVPSRAAPSPPRTASQSFAYRAQLSEIQARPRALRPAAR